MAIILSKISDFFNYIIRNRIGFQYIFVTFQTSIYKIEVLGLDRQDFLPSVR